MEKLRLGVIGTGSVVREIYRHLYFHSEYRHLLAIDAACDPNEKGLTEFCDQYNIPKERRFATYQEMIEKVKLDAVQVNTPDSLHEKPTVHALTAGLDVMVAKPLAHNVKSCHAMIEAARQSGRLMGVDFHKRDDPRFKEAAVRIRNGQYGTFQAAVFYMLDTLQIADPNFKPPFFASPDFVQKNSPISFLTVHMADSLMYIVGLRPTRVRATSWSQKLPSLKPIAAKGYDLCDTEVAFENGAVAHILTSWHLPNTAPAPTTQSARLIFTDGMLDLGLDTPGYRELTAERLAERNPLFRNFEADGTVTGYGISNPGRIYQSFLRGRNGQLSPQEKARIMDPVTLGFWTSVVLTAADRSLERGKESAPGVTTGVDVDVNELLTAELGTAAGSYR